MNSVRFAIRSFGRELRSGEVLVLLSAVVLAVAALTAVGFLTDRIGKAVARQANEVLAADMRLRSAEPIPDEWRSRADEFNLRRADLLSFPSVVFGSSDLSALSSIIAVDEGYPLRGELRTSASLFTEQFVVDGVPGRGEIWADAALLARLDADVGDTVAVGELDLEVTAVLTYRPDQSIGFASLAPSLLMNIADIPASGLIAEGSRVRYSLLVAGSDDDVSAFNAIMEDELPEDVRIRSAEESSERAYAAADRAQRFLSLTAVISLLLSAVAIAMSARRFANRRMDTVALMKSLGATQGFVITVSVLQLVALGAIGVVLGSLGGFPGRERADDSPCGPDPGRSAGPGLPTRTAGVGQRHDSPDRICAAVPAAAQGHATTPRFATRCRAANTVAAARGRPFTRCCRRALVQLGRRRADARHPARRHRCDFPGALPRRPRSCSRHGSLPIWRRRCVALWSRKRRTARPGKRRSGRRFRPGHYRAPVADTGADRSPRRLAPDA